jgi:hypothetical protein
MCIYSYMKREKENKNCQRQMQTKKYSFIKLIHIKEYRMNSTSENSKIFLNDLCQMIIRSDDVCIVL